MATLEHSHRRFAGTETRHLGGAGHALELRLDFLFHVGHGNGQINTALQAGEGFNHRLHQKTYFSRDEKKSNPANDESNRVNQPFYRKVARQPQSPSRSAPQMASPEGTVACKTTPAVARMRAA